METSMSDESVGRLRRIHQAERELDRAIAARR
jgi:hypothetical protein